MSLPSRLLPAALGTGLASATMAHATTFDISLSYSGLTDSQISIFEDAESFWETQITGYQNPVTFSSLKITATGQSIDGRGGTLGSAAPYGVQESNGIYYAKAGIMNFDTADLASLETNGSLFSVILHEMAHVIGFGSLWELNDLTVNGSGHYTGSAALSWYQSECDASATYVPVELDGGGGTRNKHWDETWACGKKELMTGWLHTPTTLSMATIASFEDLGYITALSNISAVPVPPTALLSISGILAFSGLRRRRKKNATA